LDSSALAAPQPAGATSQATDDPCALPACLAAVATSDEHGQLTSVTGAGVSTS
jgi:hypothetical protein